MAGLSWRIAALAVGLLAGLGALLVGDRLSAADPPVDNLASGIAEIRSVNGVLTATLEARETQITLGGVEVQASIYNGLYAGPLLRVRPGDEMRIRLVNQMTTVTNLHFHGIITSPLGNSDNPHIQVKPGESFDYVVKIPRYQPPGLYWYHDHTHGISEQHIMRGLSGALLVEGFARQFVGLAGIEEELLVVKDYSFDNEFNHSDDAKINDFYNDRIKTVNGRTDWSATTHPGQTSLWRVVNQSANLIIHLALEGHHLHVIGVDGQALTAPEQTDTIDLAPGSRMDVLVTAAAPGRYRLLARGVLTGPEDNQTSDRELGALFVAGSPATSIALPQPFPAPEDLRGLPVTGRRTMTLSQSADGRVFLIDGNRFDAARTDIRVALGGVEEWTIRNDSDNFHSFHIHQMHFQAIKTNGNTMPFTGRMDVVRIPERGSVTLLLPFNDPLIVGAFMYHCHVFNHEDLGMMGNIEVYDPRAGKTAQAHRH